MASKKRMTMPAGVTAFTLGDNEDTQESLNFMAPRVLFNTSGAEVRKLNIQLSSWEELSSLSVLYEEIPVLKTTTCEAAFVRKSSFAKSKSLRVPKHSDENSSTDNSSTFVSQVVQPLRVISFIREHFSKRRITL